MNRVEAERLLPRYFSGELTEDERRALMEAVLTDQDIYDAFAEEQVLAELLKDAAFRGEVKAVVAPKKSGIVWKLAIAAGFVVVLLSVVLLKRGGEPVAPPAAQPEVISLLLKPGERASGVENTLRFPAGRHILQLQVDLEKDAYAKYEAVLETDGERVRTCGEPQTRHGAASRIVIELSCDSLASGVYSLTIYGDKREAVAAYSFRVE